MSFNGTLIMAALARLEMSEQPFLARRNRQGEQSREARRVDRVHPE